MIEDHLMRLPVTLLAKPLLIACFSGYANTVLFGHMVVRLMLSSSDPMLSSEEELYIIRLDPD